MKEHLFILDDEVISKDDVLVGITKGGPGSGNWNGPGSPRYAAGGGEKPSKEEGIGSGSDLVKAFESHEKVARGILGNYKSFEYKINSTGFRADHFGGSPQKVIGQMLENTEKAGFKEAERKPTKWGPTDEDVIYKNKSGDTITFTSSYGANKANENHAVIYKPKEWDKTFEKLPKEIKDKNWLNWKVDQGWG